ncbi:hypothetical protein [Streptomyces sp. VRA16 Mangrove soil]|uniref:hypothetical protein n=1 Tax=Streptomyces sp. VRA16 Mangrove soil TaxID=2817434 RepID=UPI001A9FA245|nr:hypothetical protein [Streptomyces sp. VRA16 Mangrove soil]MBO1331759.1 hypothetical protein [Streptomyces sp. VRA16 Mangrove soil]
MTAARLAAFAAAALAAVLLLTQLPVASAQPASEATARFVELAANVEVADGHRYGLTDGTGRTMDAAQIVQAADGTYLAVYHTMLADGRFHAAVATSGDLLHWHRRHDFGAGTSQPALAADDRGGYVLAYEKDPDNHIAVRGYADPDALLAGDASERFDAPRTLSSCAEGTPAITAVHGDTVELTGHYRADCDTDRQLTATLKGFTTWHAAPDHRLDRAIAGFGNSGNIGDRDRLALAGRPMVLIEGQRWRDDFGSWSTYAYDPASGRADRVPLRTSGGSTSFANPSATLITDPGGRRALLVSLFIPAEGAAPGEAGQLVYWRDL